MGDRERFLDLVFPEPLKRLAVFYLVRLIHEDKKRRKIRYYRTLEELQASPFDEVGFHVYISPTTRDGPIKLRGKKPGVRYTQALWADIDPEEGKPNNWSLSQALPRCDELGIPPSIVIQSGQDPERAHLYWLLDEPLAAHDDLERFEDALKALTYHLHGDSNCAEAARVMRLPGTINCKAAYGPSFPICTFHERGGDERRYTFASIEEAVQVESVPTTRAFKRLKSRSRRKGSRRGQAPASSRPRSTLSKDELRGRLEGCAFIRMAQHEVATLPEPLWFAFILILSRFGESGRALAHEWSQEHPTYSVEVTDSKLDYVQQQDYRAASCVTLTENGFSCPNLDLGEGRCRLFGVRSPAEIGAEGEEDGKIGFVDAKGTWRYTRQGPKLLTGFSVDLKRQLRMPGSTVFIEGNYRLPGGRTPPLRWRGEIIAEARSLARQIAGDLGVDFICRQRNGLMDALEIWNTESQVDQMELSADFGLGQDGKAFHDPVRPIPSTASGFVAPDGAAQRLGLLLPSYDGEASDLASVLLGSWTAMVGLPELIGALLGVIAWAIITPKMQRQIGEIRALLLWLAGRAEIGKTTHAQVMQCHFGDFSGSDALVSFLSTSNAIESIGHGFHGALLAVDDVKKSVVTAEDIRRFNAFIQRAWDRSGRRRCQTNGAVEESRPFRATGVFTGEDVVLSGASGITRLLIVPVPEPVENNEAKERLFEIMPRLSVCTRSFVEWLLDQPDWSSRARRYWKRQRQATLGGLSKTQNRQRVSAAIASVLTGYHLWSGWLENQRIGLPVTDGAILRWLTGTSIDQMETAHEMRPAAWFLERVRSLLASGSAGLDEASRTRIGCHDGEIVYLLPDQTLKAIGQHCVGASDELPPKDSIISDLIRDGSIAAHDKNRRTKKKRFIVDKERVNPDTWAIHAYLILGRDGDEG